MHALILCCLKFVNIVFLVYALISTSDRIRSSKTFGARSAPEVRRTVACLCPPTRSSRKISSAGRRSKFAQQLVALESVDPACWGLKPKLHLWLELCASGTSPSLFWTYRDEDFEGTCALGMQERRAFERHCRFQGLAQPFLGQGACATPLSNAIFSAQSCSSFFFELHKQCSGVATRLFGNTPLTARASKCLPISHCHHLDAHHTQGTCDGTDVRHSFEFSGQTCIR